MDMLSIAIVIVLVFFFFWMIAIGDLMSRPDEDFPGRYDKLCWSILLTFTGLFGLIAYMMCGPTRSSDQNPDSENVGPESESHLHRAELSCLQCGARIPPDSEKCPECGWSYTSS